jgi:hypothetical protein
MSKHFTTVVVCDFEYETSGGEFNLATGDLPAVLCMVAYVLDESLQHICTVKLWRGEFGTTPPFDIGDDTLFVAYSAWAEFMIFIILSWKFPKHVFDLHTAFLAVSNLLLPYDPDEVRKRQKKKLRDASRAFGIEGWENIDKGTISEDIGEGRWQLYGREVVFDYCEQDVRNSTELLIRQLRGLRQFRPAHVEHVCHWSNYSAKSIAQIQAKGMPIDTPLWNTVQEHKHKAAVTDKLLCRFDPSYGSDAPIYTPEGEWSYARFENWLASRGVVAWPRLESGKLDISGDAFRLMHHVPGNREPARVARQSQCHRARQAADRP